MWHPDDGTCLLGDDLLALVVYLFERVASHERGEVVAERLLELFGFLEYILGLFHTHPLIHISIYSYHKARIVYLLLKFARIFDMIHIITTVMCLHNPFDALGLDKQGDRVELSHLEPFDRIAAHVQYAVFALFGYVTYRLHGRAV